MDVASFAEIEQDLNTRVSRIIWCTFVTVDRAGRPRTRIVHPLWEGSTGWITTRRQSFKGKHLAANPNVSLCYWDPQHEVVIIDGAATWEDDLVEKRRVWELYKATSEPYGYDPANIWKDGPETPDFGLLKVTPRRIELPDFPRSTRVWRA